MIIEELKTNLYESQKSRDPLKTGVYRYLLSEIKNKEIELRPQNQEVTDEVALKLLNKQMKKRREVIEEFRKAGRQDLVDKESAELGVIESFLDELGYAKE